MDSHADKTAAPLDSKPVSPSMFAHFVLRTSNRGPLRDWYLKVLNARQVFENEYISFITYDDEHHRVAFVQMDRARRRRRRQSGASPTSPTRSPISASSSRPTAG